MPTCFWTGFINSRETECGEAGPSPCDGVPPPPSSVDICGSTGGGEECEVSWALCDPAPTGYVSQAPQCRTFANTPNTWLFIRNCDGQEFVVAVGEANIVCC